MYNRPITQFLIYVYEAKGYVFTVHIYVCVCVHASALTLIAKLVNPSFLFNSEKYICGSIWYYFTFSGK